ncbi:MAG: hypothetical protein ACTSRH_07795 [Promethearchaeota archaeon]
MNAEFITSTITSITVDAINRLLSRSEPNLLEVKQVVVNGISDTISFIVHFIKGNRKESILKRKLESIFNKRENIIPFEKDFEIQITDNLGNDVTNLILEYDAAKKIIPFKKFFDLPGRVFIIDARGRFKEEYNKLFVLAPESEPFIKTNERIVYRTKVVVINKKYDAKEVIFISIPFRQMIPINFIGDRLLRSIELKAFRHLNKAKRISSVYMRRKKYLHQKLGFNPDDLDLKISFFLGKFEETMKRRFKEYISVTSDESKVQVTKVDLEFSRIMNGLPSVFLHPVICFDFDDKTNKVINITISINKEKILKLVDRIWSKIKNPIKDYNK